MARQPARIFMINVPMLVSLCAFSIRRTGMGRIDTNPCVFRAKSFFAPVSKLQGPDRRKWETWRIGGLGSDTTD